MAELSNNLELTEQDAGEIEESLHFKNMQLPSWLDRNADGMLDNPESSFNYDSYSEVDDESNIDLSIFDDSFKSRSMDVLESVEGISSEDSLLDESVVRTKDSIDELFNNTSPEDDSDEEDEDDDFYVDDDEGSSLAGSEFEYDLNERMKQFGGNPDGKPVEGQWQVDQSWPADGSVSTVPAAFKSGLQDKLELKNSLEQMIRSNYQHRINQTSASTQEIALSSDSIAFTLIYCSVFLVTLVYIMFKVTLRWRRQQRVDAESLSRYGGNSLSLSHTGNSLCSHAACQRSRILPYSGLGAIWIPEIVNLHTSLVEPVQQQQQQPVHNTSLCNNSCDSCRSLTVPPPSYTKLFLEDCPPSYTDDLVLKNEFAENTMGIPDEQDSLAGPTVEMNEDVSSKNANASLAMPETEQLSVINVEPSISEDVSAVSVGCDLEFGSAESAEPLINLLNDDPIEQNC